MKNTILGLAFWAALPVFAQQKATVAYSGGYPFSISGDIRSVPS
jgi:hypothetical protein